MKALTVCQPYADMIANREKTIENRTWSTSYRGLLAIHAGKSRAWLDEDDQEERPGLVFGAVVATAKLIDCVRPEHLPSHLKEDIHAQGPWCWILDEIEPLSVPILCRGAQGLWEWRR